MKQTLAFLTLSAALLTTSFCFAADNTAATEQKTATLTIEGMHCGSCKKMITKSVCDDAALSSNFETCEVTKLDTKKQIGTMVIKYKKDSNVDMDGVEKAIHTAGDYKLTKKEITTQKSK